MVDITLFELHVDGDPQFTPSWISGERDTSERLEGDGGTTVDVEEESSGNGGKVLIGLVALVLTAAVVRKFRGGDDGSEEFEEEPEYTVEETA
ncbi:hypothetical protein [Halostella sp. PRR32]|uniref:hypothetical protein n=1 Tax=Halostella sp. PRR32 TaxID=3098147 RepID=UPI002B1DC29B|nr:hypothetical protein [Halostella sp. PRR32]